MSDGYGLTLVTPPASEPVTCAEAKAWARVEHTFDDGLFEESIVAARELAEEEWSRTLVTTTWRATWRRFPCGFAEPLRLPRGPLQSVTQVQYVDTAGVLQTWSSSQYVVVVSEDPGLLYVANGYSWPVVGVHPEAVRVTYVAGYGTAAQVPRRAKAAIKTLVAAWYANRGDDPKVAMTDLPEAATRLLRSVWNGEY